MEKFRIREFEKSNPEIPFPWFENVKDDECQKIYLSLAKGLGLNSNEWTKSSFFRFIYSVCHYIPDVDTDHETFNLKSAMSALDLSLPEKIYINWNILFDNIDIMFLDDFSRHIEDLWYPSAEDIEIFDESHSWILLIAHYDAIGIIHLRSDNNYIDKIDNLDISNCEMKHIPSELQIMKNLATLDIRRNPIPKDEIIQLQKQLPNCRIQY